MPERGRDFAEALTQVPFSHHFSDFHTSHILVPCLGFPVSDWGGISSPLAQRLPLPGLPTKLRRALRTCNVCQKKSAKMIVRHHLFN